MRRDPCTDCDPDCNCLAERVFDPATDSYPLPDIHPHCYPADAKPLTVTYTQPYGLTARIW